MPLADSTQDTPLAPSVEKAFYRKCIELKRRLNEVEAANDEAKIRRARLDRGIMKMRLERAFLLDELRKRMEYNVDGSEPSGDEGVGTPPADRPHRDKRRRPDSGLPPAPQAPPQRFVSSQPYQPSAYPVPSPFQRLPSQPEVVAAPLPGFDAAPASMPPDARQADARYYYQPPPPPSAPQYVPSQGPAYASQIPVQQDGSPYGAPVGVPGAVNGADDREREAPVPIGREAGATGEALNAGSSIREDSNGDRKIVSSSSAENANAESEQQQDVTGPGFPAKQP